MKKLVTLMALAAMLTLGLGNALAFTEFNPILGPNTDADFQRMYGEGGPVAHGAGWNVEAVGPLPAEMEAAYGNGSPVRPMTAFNPELGPYTDQDWSALKGAGTAY